MQKSQVVLSATKNLKIRIGKIYQAQIPPRSDKDDGAEEAICMWSPDNGISDKELDNFVKEMNKNHEFAEDQALCLLNVHNHDFRLTRLEAENFSSMPRTWDHEDKTVFQGLLPKLGKDFTKIQEVLPHKTHAELVDQYYRTKKKEKPLDKSLVESSQESVSGSSGSNNPDNTQSRLVRKFNRRPKRLPEGFNLDTDKFKQFTKISPERYNEEDKELQNKCDHGILLLEQTRKKVRKLTAVAVDSVKDLRPPNTLRMRSSVWSREEIGLLLKCLEMYGPDFERAATILGTKSAVQVELYYEYIRSKGYIFPSKEPN